MELSVFIQQHLVSIVFFMFALIFLLSGSILLIDEKKFIRESVEGTGVIEKYWTEDYHMEDRPYITFEAEGKKHTVRSQNWLKEKEAPPVGTEVNIGYRKSRALGSDFWSVRIIGKEGEVPINIRLAKVLQILGCSVIIITVILFLKGV